jgi:hypothetical protein
MQNPFGLSPEGFYICTVANVKTTDKKGKNQPDSKA